MPLTTAQAATLKADILANQALAASGATQALADALSAGRTEVRLRNCAAAEY